MFSKSQLIATFALTAACGATYLGLRSLPVEACEVIHYGAYINDDGIIEGCGIEEIGFFDLEEIRYPIDLKLEPLTTPRVGQPTTFILQLHTSTGRPLAYDDIAVSHTERVHAMLVDEKLEDYQHLHPTDGGTLGTYLFTFIPSRSGHYDLYLDFIPLKTAKRTLVAASFTVGEPDESVPALQLETTGDLPYRAHLHYDETALEAGRSIDLALVIEPTSADTPLTLDPVMDAYAHLVAFTEERTGFAHFHPLALPGEMPDMDAPRLEFRFSVEEPGTYRVWAQFSVNGEERFVPFDLVLKEQA